MWLLLKRYRELVINREPHVVTSRIRARAVATEEIIEEDISSERLNSVWRDVLAQLRDLRHIAPSAQRTI